MLVEGIAVTLKVLNNLTWTFLKETLNKKIPKSDENHLKFLQNDR